MRLRAFAALPAVVHHFADNEGCCHSASCNSSITRVWGVDIFFVLSGFILAWTYLPSCETTFGSAAIGLPIVSVSVVRESALARRAIIAKAQGWRDGKTKSPVARTGLFA
ncbi:MULTISPECIES: hypothetical protein [Paraburkholderia]|uniref:hypothetical protein n=1 Tax=Paraburkholderia TaxID=1822464 RepID=UPI00039E96ED|nr:MULTISPECIES: hypothetical protein [Paraburkholderia]MDH6150535.1 hypothetical protein [Paraburkholderia sp. WSM4179]